MIPVRGADVPLYVQVKNYIRERIEAGEFKPHEALPGERVLVSRLGLSRTTVRQAIGDLVAEGVLYRRHGKGTFVAPRQPGAHVATLRGFVEELRAAGLTPSVEVLAKEVRPAPRGVAAALGLGPGDRVAFVARRIAADGEPVLIDRTYLPLSVGDLVLQADVGRESLYRLLEKFGYPVQEGLQTIGAMRLQPHDAELLNVPPDSPGLIVQRVCFVGADSPIEYTEAVFRADRFQYPTRLRRTLAG